MVSDMYWYISRTKVESLAQATRRSGPLRSLGLKVKSPVLEVSGDVALDDDRLVQDLRRVRKGLNADPGVKPFDDLDGDAGPIFAFEGRAARAFDGDGYLVAIAGRRTALILAGSRWHVLGQERDQGVSIGGSADPIVTAVHAFGVSTFDDGRVFEAEFIADILSQTWSMVMARNGHPGVVLPRVSGMALFAALYLVTHPGIRGVDSAITRLIVGSPVYIEQG